MNAKILSIGDELLKGHILNSNSSYISEKLYSIGIPVQKITIVGDDEGNILEELNDSGIKCDITIITGGLGPTHDDITRSVIAKFVNEELVLNEKILNHIKEIFKSRRIKFPESNIIQAYIPKGAMIIWNNIGTAPGMWFEKNNKIFISLPGVPEEMKLMMNEIVIPALKEKFADDISRLFKSRYVLTAGISESELYEKLGDISELAVQCRIAFLPGPKGINIRIDASGDNEQEVISILSVTEQKIKERAGNFIYGYDDDKIESIIGNLLKEKRITLSVAESCTGGMLGSKITDVSGSSEYFLGGVISYSNDIKINILGVKKSTIDKYGAVSEQTASEMAENIRKHFNSDIGISITGIAGPEGGTDNKPVGLVYLGFSDKSKTFTREFLFGKLRERNRVRAVQMALIILRNELLLS